MCRFSEIKTVWLFHVGRFLDLVENLYTKISLIVSSTYIVQPIVSLDTIVQLLIVSLRECYVIQLFPYIDRITYDCVASSTVAAIVYEIV